MAEASIVPGEHEERTATSDPNCEICLNAPSRYRCPGCSKRTCSANCVKKHKTDTGCTGKRDRTSYVRLEDFSNNILISDYEFLEDALRVKERAARTISTPTFHQHRGPRRQNGCWRVGLPDYLNELQFQARRRGTRLQFMLPGMQLRRKNNTRYDYRRRSLLWKVEFVFVAADNTRVDTQADEHLVLRDILGRFLEPKDGNAPLRQTLVAYSTAGYSNLRLFMLRPNMPANQPVFDELKMGQSLQSALASRTIIEHPRIFVALPSETDNYPISSPATPTVTKPSVPSGSHPPLKRPRPSPKDSNSTLSSSSIDSAAALGEGQSFPSEDAPGIEKDPSEVVLEDMDVLESLAGAILVDASSIVNEKEDEKDEESGEEGSSGEEEEEGELEDDGPDEQPIMRRVSQECQVFEPVVVNSRTS